MDGGGRYRLASESLEIEPVEGVRSPMINAGAASSSGGAGDPSSGRGALALGGHGKGGSSSVMAGDVTSDEEERALLRRVAWRVSASAGTRTPAGPQGPSPVRPRLTPPPPTPDTRAQILPVHFTLAMCCYIDRTNLAFAALEMNGDLGFSARTYGLGAGIFFVSYTFCQIPSNMAIARLGAPLWLGAILAVWGVLASLMATVSSEGSFLALRLLLGAAEAGTFPGIWYHLAQFYPAKYVGEAYTQVATVTALSAVVGGPLAAALMQLDGAAGLRGWQWLFVLEGVPTALMSVVVFLFLPRSPEHARWLSPDEGRALRRRSAGAAASQGPSCEDLGRVVRLGAPWHLGVIWALAECSMYGCTFWIPLIIRSILGIEGPPGAGAPHRLLSGGPGGGGTSDVLRVSFASALPFSAATVAMLWLARRSARLDERKMHLVLPLLLGAPLLGFVTPLAARASPVAGIAALSAAASAVWSIHGPIMSLPAVLVPGPGRAAAVALMNSVGAVGGFAGPYLIGVLSADSGFEAAMGALGVLLLLGGLVALFIDEGRAAGAEGHYSRVGAGAVPDAAPDEEWGGGRGPPPLRPIPAGADARAGSPDLDSGRRSRRQSRDAGAGASGARRGGRRGGGPGRGEPTGPRRQLLARAEWPRPPSRFAEGASVASTGAGGDRERFVRVEGVPSGGVRRLSEGGGARPEAGRPGAAPAGAEGGAAEVRAEARVGRQASSRGLRPQGSFRRLSAGGGIDDAEAGGASPVRGL